MPANLPFGRIFFFSLKITCILPFDKPRVIFEEHGGFPFADNAKQQLNI